MPFDPDELANGMMRWLENGRKPKPAPAEPNPYDPNVIYQNPEPSPPPAEMPGSGPSIEELQEQIKALQEQLKEIRGNADVPMAPRDGTPGEPHYPLGPGRDAPELTPEERRKKDWEMFDKWRQGSDGVPDYVTPREKPRFENLPYYYKQEEKPNWENLPYRYKEPMTESPYELLNGTGSPVEGLNRKVGRNGNKGASLN